MENDITLLATILRQKAEKLLKSHPQKKGSTYSIAETLSLIHELEVHQIELEMQNDELESKNVELNSEKRLSNETAEKYTNLYDFAPSGYYSLTRDGKITDLNLNAANKLGKDRSILVNSLFGFFVSDESKPVFNIFLEKVISTRKKISCEVELISQESTRSIVQLMGVYSEREKLCFITSIDITERRKNEKYREMNREILQILNDPGEINDSIHRIVAILKTYTGLDAVGIRLQKGNDFPYCDHLGFSEEFMTREITLKEFDKKGNLCCDNNGTPLLACTCGLVLSGKASCKTNPLVSAGGSWWTNNSFPILDVPLTTDERFHPRNQCIHQGYASVALVPIRTQNTIVGLIQFNDKRKDRFNLNVIELLEGISAHIGAALLRKQAEEEHRQSEERYKSLFENNQSVMMLLHPETGDIVDVNPAACRFYGWTHSELCDKNISEINNLPKNEIDQILQNIGSGTNDPLILKHRLATGELKDVEVNTSPVKYNKSVLFFSIINDITDRKNAQEALHRNEERYSLIYNSSRDSVFSFNMEGKFTSANGSFCKEVKHELSEVVGHTFVELGIPENLRAELDSLIHQVKETDISSLSEMKVPLADGSVRYYELILNPLHDENSNIIGIGGSARNITKRKENYRALKESEKMFRYLVKDLTVGVVLYGPLEEVVMCNPKALNLLGITEQQLKSNSFFDQDWNSIREDGSNILPCDLPVQLAFANGHSIHDFVIGVYPQPNSEINWLLVNAEVILKDDRSIRNVICSFIDITQMKKAENDLRENDQRLKYHFENSPLAVVEWDKDLIVTQWSLEAEHIFGWNKDEILGKRIDTLKLIYEEDIPFVYHSIEKLTNGEKDTFISANRNVTKSGKLIDCNWYNSVLLDKNGQTSSVMALIQDITLQKQAENALKQLNEALEDHVSERTAELLKSNEALKVAEEKYHTVSDFAFNWEYWIDPLDHMIYCSPSCEQITGYKSSEFELNSQLIFEVIHPDDLLSFHEHRNKEVKMGCDHEFQYRIIKKDGAIRWIGHFSRPVFDELGNFRGVRGSNKDITARKKMEELLTTSNQKYKLLSENITDGIFICKNGKFEYVNKGIYDIFGYQGREMERMKLTQLVMTDFHEELENFLYTNGHENQSCTLELECLRKDFNLVIVEIILNYVAKDKMVYGVVHDITEKKMLQKNMVKAIIQTEEKERAHFSKELHDGLGPLLSTIKLYLQWSERPNSNRSHSEIIGKAGEILEEALATVKEISNKLSPHLLTNYGLYSAIRSFVDKLNETASYDIEFESNMHRRIDVEIEAALYRAIIECINNTLKYAHANNIYINLIDSGDQIQIVYKDDGAGFDVTETLTKHKGLGLFNLMNRLNTIGGKVDLFSEPGKGVNYVFTVNI